MTPELSELRDNINFALDHYLPRTSDIAQAVVDAMRHTVLGGGKRVRPLLVCAAAQATGARAEDAMPVACAVEFVHAYSLIHDDLPAMDDDDLRHGLPSAHVAFGEANAILAGDSLHSLAFTTIVESENIDAASRVRLIGLLASAAGWAGMAGGQCLDIAAEGKRLTLPELHALHAAKTGALIEVAVRMGALCKPLPTITDTQQNLLAEFGQRIGLAFQVMDDVLDVTQTSAELGKPAGSDEALAKNTFPKLMGVEAARDYARTLVAEAQTLLQASKLQTQTLSAIARLVIERTH